MRPHRPVPFFRRHAPDWQLAALAAAVAMTLLASTASAKGVAATSTAQTAAVEDDEQGALVGDLVFHADLLATLDRLCPRRAAADWHAALRPLLEQAMTPELRDLSRRLGTDAGTQLVHERGGCKSPGFAAAYDESKGEYQTLLQRWRSSESQ